MIRSGKRGLLMLVFLALSCGGAGAKETFPPEAKALFQQGTAAAAALSWEEAIESFSKAHNLARSDASIYYALGVAHEKAGHLMPAMAWYTAYIAAVPDGDKADFARQGIVSLNSAIEERVRFIFASAERLARVSGYKEGPDFALLADIAGEEQNAGLLAMSKATRQLMKDHAGVRKWEDLQYSSYLIPRLNAQDIDREYLYYLTWSGDIAALRDQYGYLLTPDLEYDRGNGLYSSAEEYRLQTEINHFLLTSDRMGRVTVAESLSRIDPLRNLDVKVTRELQSGKGAEKIVQGLEWLARRIWEPLHTLHALYPSRYDSQYLSEAALDYLDAALAYIKKRDAGSDDHSMKLVWGEQQNLEKAGFLVSSLKDRAGNDRLTLYYTGRASFSYAEQEENGYLGVLTEKPLTIEGDFRALVWTRQSHGKWTVQREITSRDVKSGAVRGAWVSKIRSFNPQNGTAVVELAEGKQEGDSIKYAYSWYVFDLKKKKRVRKLPE